MNLLDLVKRETKLLIVSIFCFLLTVFGISYGYLSAENNNVSSNLVVGSGTNTLIFTDNTTITETNISYGDTFTKTITIENKNNETRRYNLIWSNLLNEMELQISATCSSNIQGNTCSGVPARSIPLHSTEVNNVIIKRNISIASGETQTYVITVEYVTPSSSNTGACERKKDFHGTISIENGTDVHPLYTVMKNLATAGTYASTYSGTSNDTYGETGTKTIYYIKPATDGDASTLLNKINVKFAGFCWQILRTTDTGGVKLIYNGEPDSTTGDCKAINTEDTHLGVIANSNGAAVEMSGAYQYADSYTYNLTAGTFTLTNPSEGNYSNNKNLIGKYTCKVDNTTTTCSTLYYLNTPNRVTPNSPYTVAYTIGATQNAQIGTSPFAANYRSPAYVGYKYGTAYDYVANSAPTSGSIMGHDVYWNGSNYVLKESDNSTSSGTTYDTNHHYTCNSTSATCTGGKVRYYFYGNYYIELLNGDDIDTALTRMLEANTYDSAMKSYLENWFRNKMTPFTDYLDENAVYCNDRSITQIGGWTNTGGIGTGTSNYLKFNNYSTITSLGCTKDTDKFSVGNSSAELNYPVGLETAPEMNLQNNLTLRTTGQIFWLVSPYYFSGDYANERCARPSGSASNTNAVDNTYGARPVVTLAPSNDPISGTGAYDDPYIIGE